MYIREVNISDIERIGQIEALTFPPAEAASPETFRYRGNLHYAGFRLYSYYRRILPAGI